ncbi:viral A-type inclusion protein [Reticulomyxa filosa]|uniref:Viral A-type inclusion protein n=1 Tax=Reticulomyxa filosa TaxID=46433 RepID=X6LZZ1_RETFI|nr:viral A-type inclusion protein [Reticulomyxa filosa]|eukprot:ETO06310.1 viral A-type inclusion protein [Reticulomyxa filosa]
MHIKKKKKEKLKLEKKIEKIEEKLTEKTQLVEQASEKFRDYRVENNKNLDELKDNIATLRKSVNEITAQKEEAVELRKKVEAENLEFKETITLKEEEISALKASTFQLKDEIHSLQHRVKKLEIDLEQEKELSKKYDETGKNLRKSILELEVSLREEAREKQENKKSAQRWSDTIVSLRHETQSLQQRVKQVTDDLQNAKNELRMLGEEYHRCRELNHDLNEQISQLNEQLANHVNKIKILEDNNLELKKDNFIKTEKLTAIQVNEQSMKAKLDTLTNDKQRLEIELQQSKEKLAVSNTLENINLDEFKNLCSTNLRVADSIRVLMDTIHQPKVSSAQIVMLFFVYLSTITFLGLLGVHFIFM